MKSSLLCLLAVGLSNSQLLFTPGSEYVYTYSGKILSGIPQVDSTFAGMSITGQVIVQATGLNTFKLAMREVGFSTFNDKLTGAEPLNWRNVITPATTPLTAMYKQHMESAVEFILLNGKISTLKISSQEPQWSVNFKKALVASLKIQLPAQGTPSFWTVMEQGIEGKCENTYQVSELPEYLINEYEQGMIQSELCQGKKYYQVMKARDITKCLERSIFLSSKTHAKCLLGNCDGLNTKSSITRYFGCGETIETIQLHGMINEGELQQNVLAFNTEPVVTGTKQVLKLVAIKPVTTVIAEIMTPKTLKDILYEFPKPVNSQVSSHEEQKEYYQLSTMDPSSQIFLPEGSLDSISKADLKVKTIEKLTTVATQLTEMENFGKKEIPSQLKSLKIVISILTTEDLMAIYNSIQSLAVPVEIKETMRTLLIDTIRMAGTSPCVMFLKEMIETEQVSDSEALIAIATLAHNIKTPTVDLIDKIFELIKSPVVTSKPILKAHGHLVFATIIRKACLTTPVTEVFPENVFGKMCTPDNLKISQVYIPHLVQELNAAQNVEQRMGSIVVLGALGHESVIPILLNYIEGNVEGCTPAVRTLAIYSFVNAKKYRDILLPVYASLVHNSAESRGIRIAAFSMLLKMQPETVHLQKLAVSTWFEQDVEMHKFVYSSLKSLSQIDLENHPEGSKWKGLTIKAQTVLPLAKPIAGIISSTFNSFISGVLKNLDVGCQMVTSMVTGSASQFLYHKTEYFLKQVQTTPVEFAVEVGGVKALARDLMKYMSSDTASFLDKINPEWKELVQNMEISPFADAPFETSVWAKFSDDIQFIFAANFKTLDFIKEKVLESVKGPGKMLEKICGKTPINFNKVFEALPYQAVVPSDLGLPIVIETQETYVASLKGEVDVVCANPSIALQIAKKAAFTYSGYAGTVSPFTNELLVAGINEHRATNIPVKAIIEIVPTTSTMKIVMKQIDEITPITTSIDIHHYHMKPFTAKKPLIFQDLTPLVLHKNTKVLKSQTNTKTFQANFGQTVGLDMTFKVDTESDLYDHKTVSDAWANYKYNPFIASWFHFTETAIKANGMPTARFHQYSVVLNPAKSVTKEAEINIMLTLATKKKSQEAQITKLVGSQIETIALSSSRKHEQSLHESIQKLKSDSALAVNALVTAKLIGGLPMTYTYSMTAGKGSSSMEHMWNLQMETENGAAPLLKMCVEGALRYPTVQTSDVKLKYFNHIGFGESCDEYFVNIDGTTSVTDKQKQYSRVSYEAKQCERLTIESQKINQDIKSKSMGQEKIKLQEKLGQISGEKLKACALKKVQSDALDQSVIEITTSDVLPTYVYTYGRLVNSGLKAMLFEYISGLPSYIQSNKVQVKLNFNQKLNTVTMYVQTPMDTMVYKNIRLPVQVQNLLPLVSSMNPVEHSYKALTGSPLYGKCVLGQGFVQTFDQKTYGYQVDQCDHILASDCSKEYDHAVLAKEVNGLKHITIYHKMTKISLTPSYSSYKLEVDGQEVEMIVNQLVYIKSKDLTSTYSVYLSADNNVVLDTPAARVTHKGNEVTVEEKSLTADGSLCGLCGDYNKDLHAEIKTPKGCVYQSSYASALSYRVKSGQCTLSQEQQKLIQSEEEKCAKYRVEKTPVSSLYKSWKQSTYSIKKHSAIYQGEKICISQEPVVQCLPGSTPKAVTNKTVKFVCLPEGRLSKLYAERIEHGESPQELRQQPVAFETKMAQPISCGISQL